MRKNPILEPLDWRRGILLACLIHPEQNILDYFQQATLAADSWGFDQLFRQRIDWIEDAFFTPAPPAEGEEAEPHKRFSRGTNRANANDWGGRVHSFFRDAAELYYAGREISLSAVDRAWYERFVGGFFEDFHGKLIDIIAQLPADTQRVRIRTSCGGDWREVDLKEAFESYWGNAALGGSRELVGHYVRWGEESIWEPAVEAESLT